MSRSIRLMYHNSKIQGVPSEVREGLNDARTTHGERPVSARRGWAGEKSDFFSILLGPHVDDVRYAQMDDFRRS
jgi:hypothetical protein